MRILVIASCILFFAIGIGNAQSDTSEKLKFTEDSILALFKQANASGSDTEKSKLNDSISKLFLRALKTENSFTYPFDSLKKVGKNYAPDQAFRIINWNLPLTDGTYEYKAILQINNTKTNRSKVYELIDRVDQVTKPENSVLSANKWFGALYYKILKNEVDNRTYYTILGLRYQSLFLTQKVIEILFFDQWGNPVFGAPIFQVDNKVKHRIVFSFSARVGMNLKYNEELKMIVFDHLAPSESTYTGQFEYYGPDFSFDGFEFVKGKWMYRKDLNIKNPNPSRPLRINHPPDSLHGSKTTNR